MLARIAEYALSALLCMMRGLYPNAAIEIDIGPAGLQDFAEPCAGQELKPDGIGGTLILMVA